MHTNWDFMASPGEISEIEFKFNYVYLVTLMLICVDCLLLLNIQRLHMNIVVHIFS